MRKILLAIILVTMLSAFLSSCTLVGEGYRNQPDTAKPAIFSGGYSSCVDSDGGIDYNVFGTVRYAQGGANPRTQRIFENKDVCTSKIQLSEQYCAGTRPATKVTTCVNGCQNGKCIAKPACVPKTCGSLGKNCGSWEDGCGYKLSCGTCSGDLVCVDGICNRSPSLNCSDTDGGMNYGVKGTLTAPGTIGNKTDYCTNSTALNEYYCMNSTTGTIFYGAPCPGGCSDGACLPPPSQCVDTDGGMNYGVKGTLTAPGTIGNKTDYCTNSTALNEYYCMNSTTGTIYYGAFCPGGCSDGACLQLSSQCIDSDGGINYFQKGYVSTDYNGQDLNNLIFDTCMIDDIDHPGQKMGVPSCSGQGCVVQDYYCNGNVGAYGSFSDCQYGCNDGACNANYQCVLAGYKCTSSVRGCGHYSAVNMDCGGTGAMCCTEIPYCGDGVCFAVSYYGENATNCPQDCGNGIIFDSGAGSGQFDSMTYDKYFSGFIFSPSKNLTVSAIEPYINYCNGECTFNLTIRDMLGNYKARLSRKVSPISKMIDLPSKITLEAGKSYLFDEIAYTTMSVGINTAGSVNPIIKPNGQLNLTYARSTSANHYARGAIAFRFYGTVN